MLTALLYNVTAIRYRRHCAQAGLASIACGSRRKEQPQYQHRPLLRPAPGEEPLVVLARPRRAAIAAKGSKAEGRVKARYSKGTNSISGELSIYSGSSPSGSNTPLFVQIASLDKHSLSQEGRLSKARQEVQFSEENEYFFFKIFEYKKVFKHTTRSTRSSTSTR